MKKTILKLLWLGFFIAISYTFCFTNNFYIKFPFLSPQNHLIVTTSEGAHWIGFAILGYIFGPIILILSILDEVFQKLMGEIFHVDRVFSIWDILRNLGGGFIGLILKHFIEIKLKKR